MAVDSALCQLVQGMASELMVLDSVSRSNLPNRDKSIIRQFIDETTGGKGSAYLARQSQSIARRFSAPMRSRPVTAGESLGVGAILGAVSSTRKDGLNVKLGPVSVPVDLALGVGGHLLSSMLAAHLPGPAEDATAAANAGLAVFGYRQGQMLAALAGLRSAATASAVAGEDPITAAAQKL